jgi:hypothetical protein
MSLGPGTRLGNYEVLARAVDAGLIANWRSSLERNPIWDAVRGEPEFVRLVERVAERERERRARVS